jgi:predicted transcriptional regulator
MRFHRRGTPRKIASLTSGTAKPRGGRSSELQSARSPPFFKKSGVRNAHAHRFRHTLATRLLEQGATFEQVADILGNSPAIVRKHYGKWSKGRQDNIDRLMIDHFATVPDTASVTTVQTNQSAKQATVILSTIAARASTALLRSSRWARQRVRSWSVTLRHEVLFLHLIGP